MLPGGAVRPLPIPYRGASRTFADLGGLEPTPARLVADLAAGRRTPWGDPLTPNTPAHLDPDLDPQALPRAPGWRPAFGQTGAAQGHLAARGVGPGDLFLFFGWFRDVELAGGRWRYVRGAPGVHAIFGWLQVGAVLPARPGLPAPAWLRGHEHFRRDLGPASTAYLAAPRLAFGDWLGGPVPGVPGAGVVRRLRPALVLTAPGASRSEWRLPAWFAPGPGRRALSHHERPARWSPDDSPEGGYVRLRSAPIGQEFVLDAGEYPEAAPWARALLAPEARARHGAASNAAPPDGAAPAGAAPNA